MKKITVLHSTTNWLAQTQTWIHSQVVNSTIDTIESHIVCDDTINLEQFKIKNIHSRKNTSIFQRIRIKFYEKFILFRRSAYLLFVGEKINAQIVHSHFGNKGWIDLPAIKKLDCNHVVTFYGYDVNQLPQQQTVWKKRYQELFKQADLFLCEGSFMVQSLEKLGCHKDKIRIQHLGVNINNIDFQPRKWTKEKKLKILIAAGFREKKGIPYALEAIARIQNLISVEVTIIGDATDKQDSIVEKEKILKTIKDLKLDNKIKLLGFQSHKVMLKEAYKHHIFLSPSITAKDGDSEGGAPVSIIEMIATGMIVVSTQHCDIPEIVNYPNKDWLVKERDVNALSERIKELIQHPERWEEMQKHARLHIESEYDCTTQGAKLANIYHSLLNHSGKKT